MNTPLPTLPGYIFGIVGRDGHNWTIQCTRCHETYTGWMLFACQWAPFPKGHQQYDSRGHWTSGERLCPACRAACGCSGCKEADE